MKKVRFIFGLFGCGSDGTLFTPSGKKIIKLPTIISFKIHKFLNDHISYTGLKGQKLAFSRIKRRG